MDEISIFAHGPWCCGPAHRHGRPIQTGTGFRRRGEGAQTRGSHGRSISVGGLFIYIICRVYYYLVFILILWVLLLMVMIILLFLSSIICE